MKKSIKDIDLYPVTSLKIAKARGKNPDEVLYSLIEGGVKIVQLREKEISVREYYKLAKLYRHITLDNDVLLIINDRLDIALSVEADGVHLGQDDFPITEARKLAGENFIIGASTHSLEEAKRAVNEGASYINVGAIFATPTKPNAEPVGVELFSLIKSNVSIPITVMGGINETNMNLLLEAGARRLAMIRNIFDNDDIAGTVKRIRGKIKNRHGLTRIEED